MACMWWLPLMDTRTEGGRYLAYIEWSRLCNTVFKKKASGFIVLGNSLRCSWRSLNTTRLIGRRNLTSREPLYSKRMWLCTGGGWASACSKTLLAACRTPSPQTNPKISGEPLKPKWLYTTEITLIRWFTLEVGDCGEPSSMAGSRPQLLKACTLGCMYREKMCDTRITRSSMSICSLFTEASTTACPWLEIATLRGGLGFYSDLPHVYII